MGYLDDHTVPPDSICPTYAVAILFVNNARYVHVCMYYCMFVFVCAYMRACICVCARVCVCVCVCLYVWVHTEYIYVCDTQLYILICTWGGIIHVHVTHMHMGGHHPCTRDSYAHGIIHVHLHMFLCIHIRTYT